MRTNKAEFSVKKESTPGTAEVLSSSDLLVRIRDGNSVEPDFEQIDPMEVQASSSRRPHLIGRRVLGFPVSYLLRGPGNLTSKPAISDMLECSMLKQYTLETIAIGAISNGPFVNMESISGSPSGATGLVFRDHADGVSELKIVTVTGTFASGDTITGATSGASATASGAPASNGNLFRFVDSDFVGASDPKMHATCQLNRDGFAWKARGSLADLTFEFRNGHPCIVSQSYIGAWSSAGDVALIDPSTYPEESIKAPRFLNGSMAFGSYSPSDIVECSLEIPINPEAREDANDSSADGVKFVDYARDQPKIRIDPAMVKAATYDFFASLIAGDTFAMTWTLGSTSGSIWDFYADEAQYVNVGVGARRNLMTAPIEIVLCGTKNDELFIHQH